MRDKAHVGLVDSHAERHRRDDNDPLLAHEALLMAGAGLGRQAGMVGHGGAPLPGQEFGRLPDGAAGHAIDDAGVAGMLVLDKAQKVVARAALRHDAIEQVRPVVTGGEQRRSFEMQTLDDVATGRLVGGRGQRDQRRLRKAVFQDAERLVVAAEIVAPLRDAMRLVDREQRDLHAAEQVQRMWQREALGGDIQQVKRAIAERPLDRGGFAGGQRGVERGGADPGLAQRVDLVFHQRDQR